MDMRIAFITAEFPALSETFIVDHITGLIDRGHSVDIFADRSRGDTVVHPNVARYGLLDRTHYWPGAPRSRLLRGAAAASRFLETCITNPRMALVAIRALARQRSHAPFSRLFAFTAALSLRECKEYDILYCQFGPDGIKGMVLREIGALRGRLLVSFRGHDLSGFIRTHGERIYDRLFEQADLLLPVSEKMKRRLVDMGCDANRVAVLRTGVDLKKFVPARRDRDPAARVRIISVGRCVEKKGFESGIRAVAKLAAQGQNVEYEIVGDGPLRENLEQLVERLNAKEAITLSGAKPPEEVARILAQSDIMLTPSVTAADGDEEGIPCTAREGMAAGLPVVATDHGGIRELVEDGESGFIVAERDTDALAEKLVILAGNPALQAAMGASGRAFVEKNDDIEKINDRLVELFRKAIESDAKHP